MRIHVSWCEDEYKWCRRKLIVNRVYKFCTCLKSILYISQMYFIQVRSLYFSDSPMRVRISILLVLVFHASIGFMNWIRCKSKYWKKETGLFFSDGSSNCYLHSMHFHMLDMTLVCLFVFPIFSPMSLLFLIFYYF